MLSAAVNDSVPQKQSAHLFQPPILLSGIRRRLETEVISFQVSDLQRRRLRFRLAALTLRRTGIIVIRNAASQRAIRALNGMVEQIWAEVGRLHPGQTLRDAVVNSDHNRSVRGYKNMVESSCSVINIRSDEDEGMMDVFHPEILLPEYWELMQEGLHEVLINDLSQHAFGQRFAVKCRNLYVNRGVRSTRFYHCDGEEIKVKSFLYLTDVAGLGEGPYCYIKGSHLDAPLRMQNQTFNKINGIRVDDYRVLSNKTALPIFCRAGDLVVSAQNGVHRGHPQDPSMQRAVLVTMLKPDQRKARPR